MAKAMNEHKKTYETAVSESVKNLSSLDSRLTALYTQAIEQGGAVPTSKAVMLNLVIYAANTELADRAFENASQILSHLTGRTILVDLAAKKTQPASVSLICGISERGDKRLCGEVIRLYADGGPVSGMTLPLLIPNVPVYLWVYGEIHSEDADFIDLLRVADHVVVDSRISGKTAPNLRAIDRLSKIDEGRRSLRDLGWISIQDWREATAQHFDAPSLRRCLEQIAEVTVRYSGSDASSVPESAPLLFASWLMERLGIAPTEVFHSRDEGYRISARQDDRPVVVRLFPEPSKLRTGRLLSVTMNCGYNGKAGTFTTEAVSDTQLSLTEDCRDICLPKKVIEAPDIADAQLAAIALSSYRKDRVFMKSIGLALQILRQLELADEKSTRFRL
jgi:glucose-6-phosphate dehydrogenase assembly protein OpcA